MATLEIDYNCDEMRKCSGLPCVVVPYGPAAQRRRAIVTDDKRSTVFSEGARQRRSDGFMRRFNFEAEFNSIGLENSERDFLSLCGGHYMIAILTEFCLDFVISAFNHKIRNMTGKRCCNNSHVNNNDNRAAKGGSNIVKAGRRLKSSRLLKGGNNNNSDRTTATTQPTREEKK